MVPSPTSTQPAVSTFVLDICVLVIPHLVPTQRDCQKELLNVSSDLHAAVGHSVSGQEPEHTLRSFFDDSLAAMSWAPSRQVYQIFCLVALKVPWAPRDSGKSQRTGLMGA